MKLLEARLGLFIAFVIWAFVGCGGLDGSPERSSQGPASESPDSPQHGLAAQVSLTCPGGASPGYYTAFIGPDSPGGPTTSKDAVAANLSRLGVSFEERELKVAASNTNASQVVAEREGARLFTAYVELIGDSWHVTEFWTCQAWIEGKTD